MKLSIVTPSYNQGKFIRDTFESILNQKIDFPLEYILVDAVSTDETPRVVAEFIPKFKAAGIEFIYICEKDSGQSNAINKGWRMATGDLIAYINSDDYYEPNVFQGIMNYFIDNPAIKWAYGGWNLVNEKGIIYKKLQPTIFRKQKLLNYCNIGQPSCFFRKELIEEFGMLNEKLHLTMDYDLWLRFSVKYSAGIMNFVISNMRYYAEAKSGNKTKEQLLEGLNLSCRYSTLFSFRRMAQYFYFLRGSAVLFLRIDITRRINNHTR